MGDEDSFLLSGADELVPYLDYASGQWTVRQRTEGDVIIRQYRPRQEGDFARIERIYQSATGLLLEGYQQGKYHYVFRDQSGLSHCRPNGYRPECSSGYLSLPMTTKALGNGTNTSPKICRVLSMTYTKKIGSMR